jgi:branched-chain amino acid transport system ATP-binding protein
MLRVRNLRAGYGSVEALRGVSLHVDAGEIVTIIGANGAGKSTLLNALAGIVRPLGGNARFDGGEIAFLPAEEVAAKGCILVPEGRQIFAELSVRENLDLGAYLRCRLRGGTRRRERHGVEQDRESVQALFPVLASRGDQQAGTLSGGEQQMLALGRALMARPRLLMMDEPSIGLAPLVVKEIFRVIAGLRAQGTTVLLVEQNARAALSIADRGYVMETGCIMAEGTAEQLVSNHDVRRAYLGRDYRSIDE